MEYFCYISKSKVDQLYSSIEENEVLEVAENKEVNNEGRLKLGLKDIFSIFSGEISFGRKDVFQRQVKTKETYLSKLKKVVIDGEILPFAYEVLMKEPPKENVFYFTEDTFLVDAIDEKNQIVTLRTVSAELYFFCSIKNFSTEPLTTDGKLRIDSSNYGFFEKRIPVTFKSVFLLSGINKDKILGSPLFLLLSYSSSINPNGLTFAL